MAFFTSPEDILYSAMISRQSHVRLEHCLGSITGVFRNVLKRDRRLLAFLSTYEASYMKKGMIQLSYDYEVTIQYQELLPASIDDIIVDDGDWDAASLLTKGMPQEAMLVTSDLDSVCKRLHAIQDGLASRYEGVMGWQTSQYTIENITADTLCWISYSYMLPLAQLRQLQGKSVFAAKNIWKSILGKSRVPAFVKPFLAFSYLTQECCYDQRAFDEVESDPTSMPSDPVPLISYGPLVEKRGICGGMAWAFKTLMDEANIECMCVCGFLKEDMKIGHMWNLVKMDGQFYHVDPSCGIKSEGVDVSFLMQPDSIMRGTHVWNTPEYPAARGLRFDYGYVEDFLAENGGTFLDDGANETYFFPDEIID